MLNNSIATIKLETARVLRDNPELRSVDMRKQVCREVEKKIPDVSHETVARTCRWLQNKLGVYLPDYEDRRYEMQEDYIVHFVRDNNAAPRSS